MALKILVNGAAGRMGHAVIAAAREVGAVIAGEIDVGGDIRSAIGACDVVIDFSTHAATRGVIESAVAAGKPLVIGTTGHTPEERAALRALAARVPTVWASNFSVGVNVLFYLVGKAARKLPDDFEIEIVEMHHRFKKDAPSGTAVSLAEVARDARGLGPDAVVHGREGITGERPRGQIGMHALRGGDVVGDHTVVFAALGERVELAHKAGDRSILARGAVRAAQWVVNQKPGVHDMQDVLGLRD